MGKSWNVIGLMSGTSLDGLDIVFTRISKLNDHYSFDLVKTSTVPYSATWEHKLRASFISTKKELDILNKEYGAYLGSQIEKFIVENTLDNVDFVASHGHTVFHNPAQGITLQIGDGKTINEITKLDVICDFRTPDVKLGGQGAPLVPIGDRLLFSDYSYCLNLGGFSNISYEYKGERIAFDICPVNIVLNYYANKAGVPYDQDGNIAQNGKIDIKLLNALNSISYYSAAIPKSLGFEFVEKEILPLIEKRQLPIEDVLRTFIAHICVQISACLDGNEKSKVLITGGGAFNIFLMNELSKFTKNEIVIPSDEIVNYKEALIFALLGVLRSENEVNCLRSVTGASVDHSSGKIFSN